MSQTLAQRRVFAARALAAREHRRSTRPSDGAASPADAAAPSGPSAPSAAEPADSDASGRFRPDSSAAGRAILTLVRAGARVVDVGPRRVLLHRDGSECEVDRAGRIDWRRR